MINSNKKYDVIVVGGGTGGVPAAIAAGRNGASVLLIEKNGFLGGLTTGGLVTPWVPTWIRIGPSEKDKEYFIKGIYAEMLDRMSSLNALAKDGHTMDEEVLKYVLEEMCLEAGVELLLHSFVFRVTKDKRQLISVDVANKSGMKSVSGKIFIDGTGDADLVALAGDKCFQGRDLDGASQPMTMYFRLGGVDTSKITRNSSPFHYRERSGGRDLFEMPDDVAAIHNEYREAQKRGEITSPRPALMYFSYSRPGLVTFNATRIQGLDGTKAEDLTKAEIEGKRQAIQILKLLKKFPAFANAYLIRMGSEIGVRETRRIIGEYIMTKEDILSGKKFEDGIARGHGPIDIHDPLPNMPTDIEMIYLPEDITYDIPYRCIVPKNFDNVLIGSRCLSATHEALCSLRIISQLYAVGQAAGVAAAFASKQNIPCNQLNINFLRQTLKKQGAIIWEEGMPG